MGSMGTMTSVLTPPAVFVGLVLALWFYKCCMMVIFQNKIIYMPSVPPFSRREKVSDYAKACFPVMWREETITSVDGKRLVLCVGESSLKAMSHPEQDHVVVLYFQGFAPPNTLYSPKLTSVGMLHLSLHASHRCQRFSKARSSFHAR